jgi:surface antigen
VSTLKKRLNRFVLFIVALATMICGGVLGSLPANATVGTNDYPSSLASPAQDAVVDPWGFFNRECVSFVAWRLNNDNGLAFRNNMNGGHYGNAVEWKQNAVNLYGASVYSSAPAAGAVAWWNANYHGASSSGHVAYVSSVNSDGSVVIEQYNAYPAVGGYSKTTVTPGSSSWPSGFIHLKDLSNGAGSGRAYSSVFQANNGNLYALDTYGTASGTGQGMMANTNPSVARLANGGVEAAFQANNGDLYVWGNAGNYSTQQGMMVGTSPSISASPSGGFRVAFQANNGNLYVFDSSQGTTNTGQGMMPGTSPAISYVTGWGYEVAFQANNGNLYMWGSAGNYSSGLGMMHDTSPAIAASPNGGFLVAFEANTGELYTYDSANGVNTHQGMMSGTSPAIAALSSGYNYEIAFQSNGGYMYVWGSGGSYNTQQGMASGTSPSIAGSGNNGFRAAFQANNGNLYTFDSISGAVGSSQGMAQRTSPSISG